jgi:hypothetical protein
MELRSCVQWGGKKKKKNVQCERDETLRMDPSPGERYKPDEP